MSFDGPLPNVRSPRARFRAPRALLLASILASSATARAAGADDSPPCPNGSPSGSVLVRLQGAELGTWKTEAREGELDALLLFTSSAAVAPAKGAPTPKPAAITIEIDSDARSYLVEKDVPLTLIDPDTAERGSKAKTLTMHPLGTTGVRLTGVGFVRPGRYTAWLTVKSCYALRYRIVIDATDVVPTLGLHATELVPAPMQVSPFQRQKHGLRECVEVDAPHSTRVLVRAKALDKEDVRQIPLDKIVLALRHDDCPPDEKTGRQYLFVHVDELPPGRYRAVLDVNGEQLAITMTIRNDWWVVAALVIAGAIFSFSVRAMLTYAKRRAANERAIAEAERAVDRRENGFTWDRLRARNAVRRARGCNLRFLFPQVPGALTDAQGPATVTGDVASYARTFAARPLPQEVRDQVERQLRSFARISTADGVDRVIVGVAELEADARTGFRARFGAWLAVLAVRHAASVQRARDLLAASDPGVDTTRAATALTSLERIRIDAEEAFEGTAADAGIGVEESHLSLLERVIPTTEAIATWLADRKRSVPDLVGIMHCDPTRMSPAAPVLEQPSSLPAKGKVAIATDHHVMELRETVLELKGRPVTPLELRYEWTIERVVNPISRWRRHLAKKIQAEAEKNPEARPSWLRRKLSVRPNPEVILAAQERLTYLFGSASRFRISVRALGQADGREFYQTSRTIRVSPYTSKARELEVWNWFAAQGVTTVGILVAAMVAIAVYWTDKPFGGLRDYVMVLTTGLGVEVGLGATSSLLKNVIGGIGGSGKAGDEET